ncbi:hypothetical protein [Streptomyces sp. NPDC002132]
MPDSRVDPARMEERGRLVVDTAAQITARHLGRRRSGRASRARIAVPVNG